MSDYLHYLPIDPICPCSHKLVINALKQCFDLRSCERQFFLMQPSVFCFPFCVRQETSPICAKRHLKAPGSIGIIDAAPCGPHDPYDFVALSV